MKLLGIDYGRKKIGLAIGDTIVKLVEPMQVLSNSRFKFQSLRLIKENNIEKIVIGLPSGKMDDEIKNFGKNLEKNSGVIVEYFDESLTTLDAQKILLASGRRRKSRKEREDAIAAAIMLQSFIETTSFI